MPRATRRLLPTEIAQIWARNVLAVRTQEGVARLSPSSRDRQVGPILRVSEMVRALPDRSIPDPVRNVLIKFGCSPSQEPLLWVSECLRREKFVLLGSFIEELIDPTSPSNKATRESVFLVLSTHFKNYGADNQEARDVARLCALSYVSEIKGHIDDCRHTDISPASNVGGVCALIVAAECMDEVFSEIPARDWKVFFDRIYPSEETGSLESLLTCARYRIRDADKMWITTMVNRVLLMDLAEKATSKEAQRPPPEPRRTRPAI